jgi:hypothetical protein
MPALVNRLNLLHLLSLLSLLNLRMLAGLPTLGLPVLRLPVLRLPVLRLPVLPLPALIALPPRRCAPARPRSTRPWCLSTVSRSGGSIASAASSTC